MSRRVLVYIRRKGHSGFDDEPARTVSCRRDGNTCSIVFASNLTTYTFASRNVAICTEDGAVDGAEFDFLIKDGIANTPLPPVRRATHFRSDNPEFEDRISPLPSGGRELIYPQSALVMRQRATKASVDVFAYLSSVSEALSGCNASGDPLIDEYLVKQFARLDTAALSSSSARCLTTPGPHVNETFADDEPIIYPFGANLSQMDAVRNALTNTLSIIEGPPGTGKTQTILNIAANLAMRGRSVLIVSPNNEATRNVVEKLRQHGLGFIVAPLGNRENRARFVADQPEYPDHISGWKLTTAQRKLLRSEMQTQDRRARDVYEAQRSLASYRAQHIDWAHERDLFHDRFPEALPLRCPENTSVGQLEALRDGLQHDTKSRDTIRLRTRLYGRFGVRIGAWRDYRTSPVELELRVDRTILDMMASILDTKVHSLGEKTLSESDTAFLNNLRQTSLELLHDSLATRHAPNGTPVPPRRQFDDHQIWHEPDALHKEHPIITSTTNAARGQLGRGGAPFDWVIIDESSQCDLVTGTLALSCARHAVVVGDRKQLPCVVTSEAAEASDRIFDASGMPDRYRYARESLLSCLERCDSETGLTIPVTLLREHYRCHPDIIGLCNRQFYGGELVIMTEAEGECAPALEVLITDDQNYDRTSDYYHGQTVFARTDRPSA